MRDNGWDDCRRELVAAVRRLTTSQYFYVVLFCSRSYRMFDSARPEPRMAPATALNLARLERWLHGFQPHDETLPLDAVRFAMSLHPDAIYLLTDGEIQDNTAEWLAKNIVRDDAYDGGSLRTVVHTIGFVSNSGQAVLQRIARDCGGTYKFAEKPPPPAPAGVRGPRATSHLSQGGTPAGRSGLPAGRPRDK